MYVYCMYLCHQKIDVEGLKKRKIKKVQCLLELLYHPREAQNWSGSEREKVRQRGSDAESRARALKADQGRKIREQ